MNSTLHFSRNPSCLVGHAPSPLGIGNMVGGGVEVISDSEIIGDQFVSSGSGSCQPSPHRKVNDVGMRPLHVGINDMKEFVNVQKEFGKLPNA